VNPADVEKLLGEGEQSLVSSARVLDPDALRKVCAHWRVRFDALVNPDGAEPTDNQRRVAQGLFYRGRRTGLHRWSLVATDGQHEVLKTIVSAASNLRAQDSTQPGANAAGPAGTTDTAGSDGGAAEATEPHEDIDAQDATDVTTGTALPTEGPDASTDATGAAEATGVAEIKQAPQAPEATGSSAGSEGVHDVDVDLEAELEGDRETGGFRDLDGIGGAGAFSDPGILWAQQVRAAGAAEARTAAKRAAAYAAAMAGEAVGWNSQVNNPDDLDERTRNQQELDGMISALTGALALTTGDAAPDGGGGIRPQVLVTIDYQTLLDHAFRPSSELPARRSARFDPELCPEPCCDSSLEAEPWVDGGPASADDPPMEDVPATEVDSVPDQDPAPGQPSSKVVPGGAPPDSSPGDRGSRYSSASYAGEISPTTIRAWACDAELIPVVLGGDGEVLDLGRSQRLFTRKLRRAIIARDSGCTAPGCTIPAPWCEAHHVEHWEHGGPSSVDNGVLLCSHHHHAVHAGAWTISMRHGVPWFIPAAYRDPYQRPRRNTYWRPGAAA
jgi:hypothetical protein